MAAVLTDRQLTFLAKSGNWKFDLAIKDARNFNDSVVYEGQGVADLDRLIERLTMLQGNTRYKLLVDVGSLFSDYRQVDILDVRALKAKFIAIFGNVNKVDYPFNVELSQATREIAPYVTSGTIVPGTADELYGGNPATGTPNPAGLLPSGEFEAFGDGHDRIPPPLPPDEVRI